jgi:hypothetical protein
MDLRVLMTALLACLGLAGCGGGGGGGGGGVGLSGTIDASGGQASLAIHVPSETVVAYAVKVKPGVTYQVSVSPSGQVVAGVQTTAMADDEMLVMADTRGDMYFTALPDEGYAIGVGAKAALEAKVRISEVSLIDAGLDAPEAVYFATRAGAQGYTTADVALSSDGCDLFQAPVFVKGAGKELPGKPDWLVAYQHDFMTVAPAPQAPAGTRTADVTIYCSTQNKALARIVRLHDVRYAITPEAMENGQPYVGTLDFGGLPVELASGPPGLQLDADGTIRWNVQVAAVGLAPDVLMTVRPQGRRELALMSLPVVGEGGVLNIFPFLPDRGSGAGILDDVDGDGVPELIHAIGTYTAVFPAPHRSYEHSTLGAMPSFDVSSSAARVLSGTGVERTAWWWNGAHLVESVRLRDGRRQRITLAPEIDYLGGLLAVADVDGDGNQELIFGLRDSPVQVVSSDGVLLRKITPPARSARTIAGIHDVDGDGHLEMIVHEGYSIDLATGALEWEASYVGERLWTFDGEHPAVIAGQCQGSGSKFCLRSPLDGSLVAEVFSPQGVIDLRHGLFRDAQGWFLLTSKYPDMGRFNINPVSLTGELVPDLVYPADFAWAVYVYPIEDQYRMVVLREAPDRGLVRRIIDLASGAVVQEIFDDRFWFGSGGPSVRAVDDGGDVVLWMAAATGRSPGKTLLGFAGDGTIVRRAAADLGADYSRPHLLAQMLDVTGDGIVDPIVFGSTHEKRKIMVFDGASAALVDSGEWLSRGGANFTSGDVLPWAMPVDGGGLWIAGPVATNSDRRAIEVFSTADDGLDVYPIESASIHAAGFEVQDGALLAWLANGYEGYLRLVELASGSLLQQGRWDGVGRLGGRWLDGGEGGWASEADSFPALYGDDGVSVRCRVPGSLRDYAWTPYPGMEAIPWQGGFPLQSVDGYQTFVDSKSCQPLWRYSFGRYPTVHVHGRRLVVGGEVQTVAQP